MGRPRAFFGKVVMPRGKPTGQVGTFSLETTSQSKLLRERLEGNSRSGALCLPRASPRLKSPVKSIQRAIQRTWPNSSCFVGGQFLRMKVEHGPAALDRFENIIFQTVFKESKNESPP